MNEYWRPVEVEPDFVQANGTGSEARAPQRSLFCFVAFMDAKPVRTKGCSRRSMVVTASLLEGAFNWSSNSSPPGRSAAPWRPQNGRTSPFIIHFLAEEVHTVPFLFQRGCRHVSIRRR